MNRIGTPHKAWEGDRCRGDTGSALSVQVVTYKWLARHCAISASLAKQLLFAFAEAHRGKIAATYFLSGWTKPVADASCSGSGGADGCGTAGGGSGRRHIAQLVDAARLEDRKAELAEVTSLHVYSVQPVQPKVRQCTGCMAVSWNRV
jgi:DNA polymerase subunit Cdc27